MRSALRNSLPGSSHCGWTGTARRATRFSQVDLSTNILIPENGAKLSGTKCLMPRRQATYKT